jgi:hypothetical protein
MRISCTAALLWSLFIASNRCLQDTNRSAIRCISYRFLTVQKALSTVEGIAVMPGRRLGLSGMIPKNGRQGRGVGG